MDQPVRIRFDGVAWSGFDVLTVLDDWEPKDRTLYRKGNGRDVVSASVDWQFREGESCYWVKGKIPHWGSDKPLNNQGRHAWMLNNACQLEAFYRAACITEDDYMTARIALTSRYIWLCANTEPKRTSKAADVINAFGWARETIERKSDAQLQADLKHTLTDCVPVGDLSGVDAFAARAKAKSNGHKPQAQAVGRQFTITRASDIQAKRVRWLWEGVLIDHALNILGGMPGVGKSTFLAWLMADITNGTLPGEGFGTPRNVLVLNTEDNWESTVKPRLMAAGADMSRVLRAGINDDPYAQPVFPDDFPELTKTLEQYKPALVISDPISGRLGKLDTNKNNEVRQALEPLSKLAEEHKVAVLGTMHPNKAGNSAEPMHALASSAAFIELARQVLYIHRDTKDETGYRRVLGSVKLNLAKDDRSLKVFTLESTDVGEDPIDGKPIITGKLVWGSAVEGSIREHMESNKQTQPTVVSSRNTSGQEAEELTKYIREVLDGAEGKWMYWVDMLDMLDMEGMIKPKPANEADIDKWERNVKLWVERRLKDPAIMWGKSLEFKAKSIIKINPILDGV